MTHKKQLNLTLLSGGISIDHNGLPPHEIIGILEMALAFAKETALGINHVKNLARREQITLDSSTHQMD
jgi:hypothetical protein